MTDVHHADQVFESNNNRDHDLLIKIDTKVERAINDIADLKDNMASRVSVLEESKQDKKDSALSNADFETRIRFLERWVWGAIAILAVAEALVTIYYHLK